MSGYGVLPDLMTSSIPAIYCGYYPTTLSAAMLFNPHSTRCHKSAAQYVTPVSELAERLTSAAIRQHHLQLDKESFKQIVVCITRQSIRL